MKCVVLVPAELLTKDNIEAISYLHKKSKTISPKELGGVAHDIEYVVLWQHCDFQYFNYQNAFLEKLQYMPSVIDGAASVKYNFTICSAKNIYQISGKKTALNNLQVMSVKSQLWYENVRPKLYFCQSGLPALNAGITQLKKDYQINKNHLLIIKDRVRSGSIASIASPVSSLADRFVLARYIYDRTADEYLCQRCETSSLLDRQVKTYATNPVFVDYNTSVQARGAASSTTYYSSSPQHESGCCCGCRGCVIL